MAMSKSGLPTKAALPSADHLRDFMREANTIAVVRNKLTDALYEAAKLGMSSIVTWPVHNMTQEDRQTLLEELRGQGYTIECQNNRWMIRW